MRNHLGQYECRLCLTLHNNEGNYLAHTQVSLASSPLKHPGSVSCWHSPTFPARWLSAMHAMRSSSFLPPMCMPDLSIPGNASVGQAASAEHGKTRSQGGSREASAASAPAESSGEKDGQDRAPGLPRNKAV